MDEAGNPSRPRPNMRQGPPGRHAQAARRRGGAGLRRIRSGFGFPGDDLGHDQRTARASRSMGERGTTRCPGRTRTRTWSGRWLGQHPRRERVGHVADRRGPGRPSRTACSTRWRTSSARGSNGAPPIRAGLPSSRGRTASSASGVRRRHAALPGRRRRHATRPTTRPRGDLRGRRARRYSNGRAGDRPRPRPARLAFAWQAQP